MIARYVLALVLSFLVMVGWQMLNPPPRRVPPPGEGQTPALVQEQTPAPVGDGARPGAATDPVAPPAPVDPTRVQHEEKTAELTFTAKDLGAAFGEEARERMRLNFSSAGGVISSAVLPEFGAKGDPKAVKGDPKTPYELLYPGTAPQRLLHLNIASRRIPPAENWELLESGAGATREIQLRNDFDGVRVTKTVRRGTRLPLTGAAVEEPPPAGFYHVDVVVTFENATDAAQTFDYELYGASEIDSEPQRDYPGADIYLGSGSWGAGGQSVSVDWIEAEDVVSTGWQKASPAFVAVRNNYFVAILYPDADAPGVSPYVARAFAMPYSDSREVKRRKEQGEDPSDAYQNLRTGLLARQLTLAPGQRVQHRYGLLLAPRDRQVLQSYPTLELEKVNDFGFLVRLFVWLLDVLRFGGSWGVAIILLTVLVKLCLHPLNRKSQANMHRFSKKMSKVKPEMEALKERYANDRMKQNQEMQRLFKEKGINPAQQLGGCLLIFLQLPIWFALFRTLGYAFGLRQASFLYIEDLTLPDRLFELGIEAFGDMFYHFNILPLLYVIFTLINQRLQPRPDDPQMQATYRMMTIMMVAFGFIFYNFPAGFMLYIMTSMALGIIESKIIKAELAREEAAAGGANGDGSAAGPLYPGKSDRDPSVGIDKGRAPVKKKGRNRRR